MEAESDGGGKTTAGAGKEEEDDASADAVEEEGVVDEDDATAVAGVAEVDALIVEESTRRAQPDWYGKAFELGDGVVPTEEDGGGG